MATLGQLSVAFAAKETIAPHEPLSVSTDMSFGQAMTGSSVSLTVTLKEHSEELPEISTAVTVTTVVPKPKNEPVSLEYATENPQSSEARASKLTVAPQVPASADSEIFAGHSNMGACVSTTVTVKEQVAELPASSVAVAVNTVEPSAKNDPDSWLYVTLTEQLSVAVASNVTVAPQRPG